MAGRVRADGSSVAALVVVPGGWLFASDVHNFHALTADAMDEDSSSRICNRGVPRT
jgi:hypothetical protein